jgi:hypothetical protein
VDGKRIVEIYSDGDIKVQDISGVIALADAIKDMRALTSLDLSSNDLKAEGGKIVAESIKVPTYATAVGLAPFSCPSVRPLVELLLFAAIHRIMEHWRASILRRIVSALKELRSSLMSSPSARKYLHIPTTDVT